MTRSIRLALTLALLAALAFGATAAEASHGRHAKRILDTRLVGLDTPFQVLVGVTGAGRPWTLEKGRARLFADGRLDLRVRGLLLGPGGTNEGTNPSPTGRATVSCNGGLVATDKVQSATVPFSPKGDAHVDQKLILPSPCRAPVIFFGNAGGAWFAVSG